MQIAVAGPKNWAWPGNGGRGEVKSLETEGYDVVETVMVGCYRREVDEDCGDSKVVAC